MISPKNRSPWQSLGQHAANLHRRRPILTIATAAVVFLGFVPHHSQALRIERILWNALRFRQQVALLDGVTDKTGIPLSTFDVSYLFNEFPSGYTASVNGGFQFNITTEDFVFIDVPYVVADWDDGGPRGGLGDILLEYQHVFRFGDNNGNSGPLEARAGISEIVLSLDFIAPTGDKDRAIGEGAWLTFPSVTGIIPLSDKTLLAPTVAYLHSFDPVLDRALSDGVPQSEKVAADVRQLKASLNLVHVLKDPWSVLVSPDYTFDFESKRSTWDIRAGIAVELSDDSGFSLQFTQHAGGPALVNRSLSAFFTHYF